MEQKKRTFNVLFLMRRNKQSDAEASLFCRITIRGQRYEFPLNCKVRARNWNAAVQKSTGKTEVDRDANTRIEDIKLFPSCNNLPGQIRYQFSVLYPLRVIRLPVLL